MEPVRKTILYIIALLLISGLMASSCKTAAREEKFYEKQEAKVTADQQKAYNRKLKDFEKMQSKGTRKMMKETEKQAKKFNKPRKR
jgi:hypothetical protein